MKYESASNEIGDLEKEHQAEKETLLDTIRDQNQEVEYYKKVVEIMMSEGEMEKIKSKAEWDDESKAWTIPLFIVQNKQVLLPKLPKAQGIELIENDKKSRALNFVQDNNGPNSGNVGVKGHSNGKSQKTVPLITGGNTLLSKEATTNKSHPSKREMGGDEQGKHMFNWELLNSKYVGAIPDKKPRIVKESTSSENVAAALRKNAHLESLNYNPSNKLSPVDEEDIKQNINAIDQAVQLQSQRKPKGLSKIDESLLSQAAKGQTKEHNKSPIISAKGNMPSIKNPGKLRQILDKKSSFEQEKE
jgi:hypothetical protein